MDVGVELHEGLGRRGGLAGRLGRLAPGYRADVVALDPAEVTVLATWVAGR